MEHLFQKWGTMTTSMNNKSLCIHLPQQWPDCYWTNYCIQGFRLVSKVDTRQCTVVCKISDGNFKNSGRSKHIYALQLLQVYIKLTMPILSSDYFIQVFTIISNTSSINMHQHNEKWGVHNWSNWAWNATPILPSHLIWYIDWTFV